MKVFRYLSERFPIIPVVLFALGYGALGVGVRREDVLTKAQNFNFLFIFALIFIFFLLRQRITDEFKDADHDLKNFPERPVPRGLISKRQLIYLGAGALFFEWFFVFLLGKSAFFLYLPVFIYSLLMAKEFFASNWLNKHFNFYLLTHEFIYFLFGIFFVFLIGGWNFLDFKNKIIAVFLLYCAPFSIEIVRKFSPRYDRKSQAVKDTYSTVWGRSWAIAILLILGLLSGLLLAMIKGDKFPYLFSSAILIAGITLGKKSDKVIIIAGSLNFLGLAFISNFLW